MKMLDLPSAALNAAVSAASDHALDARGAVVPLTDVPVGGFATIHAIAPTANDGDHDLVMRLIEIGFVPGERIRVIAVGRPGHEPIAVRLSAAATGRRNLNGATFALRRHEAGFIRVVPDDAR
jgi:ferrous iron transport protein A